MRWWRYLTALALACLTAWWCAPWSGVGPRRTHEEGGGGEGGVYPKKYWGVACRLPGGGERVLGAPPPLYRGYYVLTALTGAAARAGTLWPPAHAFFFAAAPA